MRGLPACLIGPLALIACSPAPQADNAAAPEPVNIALPIADCPEEQLSCGKQKPVVSDGVRPFENDDMAIRAWFPKGDRVCMSRSGDAARGFYAEYDLTERPCSEPGTPRAFIGISSSFNAMEWSLADATRDCRPLSAALLKRFGGKPPAFPGHPSRACEEIQPDGWVVVTVHTTAGRRVEGDTLKGLTYFYRATLGTRPDRFDRFDRDVPRFRAFLRRLQIDAEFKPPE
ncbi:hypothetical protein OF829_07360 [Sphingomonas sp. LB-2]|uniref:hypothetical protein n=1 Tax=Sphingomonas caeni TaxID=2984949 RepID=UPI00222E85D9|nr:hypothetical protein [Sphingomonas caeni]MCW3847053.1 hypothetical protein [Sphingomonas caeni]